MCANKAHNQRQSAVKRSTMMKTKYGTRRNYFLQPQAMLATCEIAGYISLQITLIYRHFPRLFMSPRAILTQRSFKSSPPFYTVSSYREYQRHINNQKMFQMYVHFPNHLVFSERDTGFVLLKILFIKIYQEGFNQHRTTLFKPKIIEAKTFKGFLPSDKVFFVFILFVCLFVCF